ncbi:MAG: hypothetical protein KGL39_43470 [Patescibacteria group bacterium]|nr:hypothetical protein [Patescibacteria group bacterium]
MTFPCDESVVTDDGLQLTDTLPDGGHPLPVHGGGVTETGTLESNDSQPTFVPPQAKPVKTPVEGFIYTPPPDVNDGLGLGLELGLGLLEGDGDGLELGLEFD